MARKGWDALSEAYRLRLTKGGVTRERYESGDSLAKARGHQSSAYERAQSQTYRTVDRWLNRYIDTYGGADGEVKYQNRYYTRDELRTEVMRHGRAEAENAIRYQTTMERAFDKGQTTKAERMFKAPSRQPKADWIFYYHGSFH